MDGLLNALYGRHWKAVMPATQPFGLRSLGRRKNDNEDKAFDSKFY